MVLVANPAAMSEGVSLHQDCHDAVYLDRTFNAGHYLQSLDRIHRLGLAEDIVTRMTFLVSVGTIDEIVDQRLRTKAERLSQMLEDEDLVTMALPDEEEGYSDSHRSRTTLRPSLATCATMADKFAHQTASRPTELAHRSCGAARCHSSSTRADLANTRTPQESYWHHATGGIFAPADLDRGQHLLLNLGLLVELDGKLTPAAELAQLLEGSVARRVCGAYPTGTCLRIAGRARAAPASRRS